ncbi:hypothetical protein D3C71_1527730 [compost metagenome]
MAPAPDRAQVLQEYLGAALGPAQALFPQPPQGLGHQDPAQSARLVEDGPVVALQFPADVDVLGDHVQAPVAHAVQRRAAERRDDARHREDLAVDALGALDESDDRRELAHLDAADHGGPGADTRVAGDGAHARVVDQRRHKVGGGVGIQHRVAVDADQVFAAGRQGAHAQRHGLALVLGQMHHAQPRVLAGQAVQHLARAVA